MLSLKKTTKYIILFLIFAISIYIGITRSNIFNSFSPQDLDVDISGIDKEFKKYQNKKKVKLVFHGSNPEQTISALKEFIKKNNIETVFSEGKFYTDSQYFSEINDFYFSRFYEFPSDSLDVLMEELRGIANLREESILTTPSSHFNVDIETRLKDQQFLKDQVEKKIAKVSGTESMEKYQKQYELIQTKMDSLRTLSSSMKHNSDNVLLSLTVIKRVPNKNRLIKSVRIFLVSTFVSLGIFTFIAVILFFIMTLGLRAMKTMGIRTSKGSSSSYNYYSRYKPYQRRVKRINKGPRPTSEDKK